MSAIDKLNQGTPSAASLIPFYDSANGRDASCSVTALAALILSGLSSVGFATQYASPNATGFAITVQPPIAGAPMWLLITPTAGFAAQTINLPIGVDGQEVLVNCTQSVTTLTVAGALVGAANQPVNGAPTTLAANGFFRMKFSGVSGSWYRV
jgi:hypothetical protein